MIVLHALRFTVLSFCPFYAYNSIWIFKMQVERKNGIQLNYTQYMG